LSINTTGQQMQTGGHTHCWGGKC